MSIVSREFSIWNVRQENKKWNQNKWNHLTLRSIYVESSLCKHQIERDAEQDIAVSPLSLACFKNPPCWDTRNEKYNILSL